MKKKLEQAIGIKQEITALEQERQALKSMAERAVTLYPPGGLVRGGASKVEIGALDILELEEELAEKQSQYAATYREISQQISRLDDPTHRTILRLRYLYGAPWKLICDQTHYSWGGVHHQHSQALEELGRWQEDILH